MEAAVILPVYLCLIAFVLTFFSVLAGQVKTQATLNETVRNTALYGELVTGSGSSGSSQADIRLTRSRTWPIPVGMFGRKSIAVSQQAVARRWIGWDPHEFDGDGDVTVYVTETGRVYHLSRGCTYLNPSIRAVSMGSLDSARNSGGGRYRRCPLCGRSAGGTVFITSYGDAYHSSRTCSGLKRTIFTMKLKEAQARYPACSKCGN